MESCLQNIKSYLVLSFVCASLALECLGLVVPVENVLSPSAMLISQFVVPQGNSRGFKKFNDEGSWLFHWRPDRVRATAGATLRNSFCCLFANDVPIRSYPQRRGAAKSKKIRDEVSFYKWKFTR